MKEFSELGLLNHSLEHLAEMKDKIPYLSREEQARYVDAMVYHNINDIAWIRRQKIDEATSSMFKKFNTTAIGNVAYVALHCTVEEIRKQADALLDRYKEWHEKKMRNEPK